MRQDDSYDHDCRNIHAASKNRASANHSDRVVFHATCALKSPAISIYSLRPTLALKNNQL